VTGDRLQERNDSGGPDLSPVAYHLSPKKLMIRVPNWVGDAVMAEPALRQFRRIFSEAHITLVARPWVAGLFEGEGLADDLISVDDAKGFAQSASHFLSNAKRLRRERFDLAILLQNAMGAALLARAGGAARVAGYPTDGRRLLLDYAVPLAGDYKTTHQVRYYLNIASHLELRLKGETSVEIETAEPRLHVTQEAKERALRLLPAAHHPIVAINPGATNSRAKQWIAERFAETADRLAERDGFQTIIVGAAGDISVANEVAASMRSRPVVLAGQTSIAELKALLSCAALVVSNDTGTAHVSAALRVPTVVVFGPTEHVSTRPLSPVATVVRHDVECSPCMLRDCPIDHRCMTGVEVNDVYRAARSLLVSRAG
jgi:heptosyltransferase II